MSTCNGFITVTFNNWSFTTYSFSVVMCSTVNITINPHNKSSRVYSDV